MSKDAKILTVFIASPSDVGEERLAAARAIQEINQTLGPTSSYRLELVGWETHAIPGLGADAQDVINQAIPEYDIFVGIMWSRFGRPTLRAASGTLEEFQAAKVKYENDPESVRVMFYFKNKPIPIDQIDPEQIQQIVNFKK